MINWFITVFKRWNDFSGRSRRSEYWYFCLAQFIVLIILAVIDGILGTGILSGLFSLFALVPCLALSIRRLHDIGKSGWWLLLLLVPLLGALVLIYFAVLDSQPGSNQYGPSPKG